MKRLIIFRLTAIEQPTLYEEENNKTVYGQSIRTSWSLLVVFFDMIELWIEIKHLQFNQIIEILVLFYRTSYTI